MGKDLWAPPCPSPCSGRATSGRFPGTTLGWASSTHPPAQPVPAFRHPQSEKVFPDAQGDPPVWQRVPITARPVTGHRWKSPAGPSPHPAPGVCEHGETPRPPSPGRQGEALRGQAGPVTAPRQLLGVLHGASSRSCAPCPPAGKRPRLPGTRWRDPAGPSCGPATAPDSSAAGGAPAGGGVCPRPRSPPRSGAAHAASPTPHRPTAAPGPRWGWGRHRQRPDRAAPGPDRLRRVRPAALSPAATTPREVLTPRPSARPRPRARRGRSGPVPSRPPPRLTAGAAPAGRSRRAPAPAHWLARPPLARPRPPAQGAGSC